MQTTRRAFMKHGAATGMVLTAAGLVPRRIYAASDSPAIRHRDLGKTGWKVSEIGFGAGNMRDPELVHAAIDAGLNYIDTAHKYMNGLNEEVVGRVMRTKRDKVFLTTKLVETEVPNFPRMIETSLRRLNTDHVDLLLAHSLDTVEWIMNDDIMKQLDDIRRKGQARFIGFSAHSFPVEFLEAALKTDFWEAVQVPYNYLSPPDVATNIQNAREAGLATIAMKTQMDGVGYPDAANTITTPHQAAAKWVLDNSYVDTAIQGITTFEQLGEDLAVMEMELSGSDKRDLRRFGEAMKGAYCRGVLGCTDCRDQCPRGVQVHELNRCLGYAYGYGDRRLAVENYDALPASSQVTVCSDCNKCVVTCPNGMNLTESIRLARNLFG